MTSSQPRHRGIGPFVVLAVSNLIAGAASPAERSIDASPYGDRWVYCSLNLQVDQSVDALIAIIGRAKKSGYTGIMLAALTPWGFFRYWWVTVKFALTVVLTVAGIALLGQWREGMINAVVRGTPVSRAAWATIASQV